MAEFLAVVGSANSIIQTIDNCLRLIGVIQVAVKGYDPEVQSIPILLKSALDALRGSDLPSDENLGPLLRGLEGDLSKVTKRIKEDDWFRRLFFGSSRKRVAERLQSRALHLQLQVITTVAIRSQNSKLWTLREAKEKLAYKWIDEEPDSNSIVTTYEGETFACEMMDVGPNPGITRDRKLRLIRIVQVLGSEHGSHIAAPLRVLESDKHFFLLSKTSFKHTLRENLQSYDCPTQNNAIMALALALERIHDCEIVHKRINSFNILADQEGKVELAGFISSRMALGRSDNTTSTNAHVEQRMIDLYQAPERRREPMSSYSTSCDIYSLGIVMLEIITGSCLYDNSSITDGSNVIGIMPSHALSPVIKLCINDNAPMRPDIGTLVAAIRGALNMQ